jgi:hypothetical protein
MSPKPNDYLNFNSLVKRIEFHERKFSGCVVPVIQTEVYIDERRLSEFCEWIAGEDWTKNYQKELFKSNYEKLIKSKRERPSFELRTPETTVQVYPKQNMVLSTQAGIHYICQHSFDMFPYDVRTTLMSSIGRQINIGLLYPKPVRGITQDPLLVTNKDIDIGFMQSRETNLTYKDNFVAFIKAQRAKEEKQ